MPRFRRQPDNTDPRKQVSGTTLSAEGSLPVPPDAETEIGSAKVATLRDVVPELGTLTNQIRTYDRMSYNDAAVDVSLRAAKTPVLGAEYFVDPYDSDPVNMEIAEFVRFNLLDGTSAPFLLTLEESLRMLDYGFSVLEQVYEMREWSPNRSGANRRQYTMLKKLAPRPASTIKEFQYDDQGGPKAIVQNALDASGNAKEVTIPIEKAIIFTYNKRAGNLEGRSILRSAYKHWYYKDYLYKIDAIQKERHGIGVPFVSLPVGYGPDDKTAALSLVQNLRTNEEAGFVQPPGYEMGFKKPEGELVDIMKSIEHHNGMIMLNVMTQFLLLGIQDMGGGGRATSSSHQNMYEKASRSLGSYLCQMVNLHCIPRLVAYNFPTDKFPKLRVRNIGEGRDMQMWCSAMANLIAQNAITVDLATEQWIRQQIDAPMKLGEREASDNEPGSDLTPDATEGDVPSSSRKGDVGPGTNNAKQGQGNMPKGNNPS